MEINRHNFDARQRGTKYFVRSVSESIAAWVVEQFYSTAAADSDDATSPLAVMSRICQRVGRIYNHAGVWLNGKDGYYEWRGGRWLSRGGTALTAELRCLCMGLSGALMNTNSDTAVVARELTKASAITMIRDHILLEQTETEERFSDPTTLWRYPNGLLDTHAAAGSESFTPLTDTDPPVLPPPFEPVNAVMGVDYPRCDSSDTTGDTGATGKSFDRATRYLFWQLHSACVDRAVRAVYVIGEYGGELLRLIREIFGTYIPSRAMIVPDVPSRRAGSDTTTTAPLYFVDCAVGLPSTVDHTCAVVNRRSPLGLTASELWRHVLAATEEVEQPISVQTMYETIRYDNNSVERFVATCMRRVPAESLANDEISVDRDNERIMFREPDIVLMYNAFCKRYGVKKLPSNYLMSHIQACGFPVSGEVGIREIQAYVSRV